MDKSNDNSRERPWGNVSDWPPHGLLTQPVRLSRLGRLRLRLRRRRALRNRHDKLLSRLG